VTRLCECGCGQPAPVSAKSRPDRGLKRGDQQRYILGHSSACQPGPRPDDPRFKGDEASYFVKHLWLNQHYPKTGICVGCGPSPRTEYALIHGREYTRNLDDYQEMCHRCHMEYDGNMRKAQEALRQKREGGDALSRSSGTATRHGFPPYPDMASKPRPGSRAWLLSGMRLRSPLSMACRVVRWTGGDTGSTQRDSMHTAVMSSGCMPGTSAPTSL
jgi:hypothetical protein